MASFSEVVITEPIAVHLPRRCLRHLGAPTDPETGECLPCMYRALTMERDPEHYDAEVWWRYEARRESE